MGNGPIHQHKLLAEGKDVDVGDTYCETPFGGKAIHGGEEVSKKRHLNDGKRSLGHLEKSADHGPHEMNLPRNKDGD